jgi:hypothetical protein
MRHLIKKLNFCNFPGFPNYYKAQSGRRSPPQRIKLKKGIFLIERALHMKLFVRSTVRNCSSLSVRPDSVESVLCADNKKGGGCSSLVV